MKIDANIAFVSMNAGHIDQIGHSMADSGWNNALNGMTRWKPNVPTTLERVNWCVSRGGLGLHIHNPGGLNPSDPNRFHNNYAEMTLHQAWYSTMRMFLLSPDSERFKKWSPRMNWMEFATAAKAFPHKLSVWLGGPHNLAMICKGESKACLFDRAKAAVLPFSEVCHYIFFDSWRGTHPNQHSFYNGPKGMPAQLMRWLEETKGIVVGREGPEWSNSTEWLGPSKPQMAKEDFYRNKVRINWKQLLPYDPVPLRPPGPEDSVYIIVDTKYAADNAVENQKIVDQINKCQQDFPLAKMVVYAGHLNEHIMAAD